MSDTPWNAGDIFDSAIEERIAENERTVEHLKMFPDEAESVRCEPQR